MATPGLEIKKYKEVNIPVEAVQITAQNIYDVCDWCGGDTCYGRTFIITIGNFGLTAEIGDYVTRDYHRKFGLIKAQDFPLYYQEIL